MSDWSSKYKADYEIRRGASSAWSGRGSGMSRKMNPHEFDKIHGGTMSAYGELQQIEKEKLPKLQSKGKTTLLTQQTTRKGGKSSGGGGGKFGWIRRAIGKSSSPWSLLVTDKNY
tara:strand:+ start:1221 stop:1565 length:345 start_codon:yes stop_codon:yes gene_type:complete